MGPRGVGAWRLFDRLRRPYQNRHHHEAEADKTTTVITAIFTQFCSLRAAFFQA